MHHRFGSWMTRPMALIAALLVAAAPAAALGPDPRFPSIDGGTLDLRDWEGRPVLVVNTASMCAFTPQYDALQALYDRYRDRGLVVLAVPSDDFSQEFDTEAEVKDFCEINFDLDLPMTEITRVRGRSAHPFYRWLSEEHGVRPRWNFAKVLIGPSGDYAGSWGSTTAPLSRQIVGAIEPLLPE